jgi:putative SOS response-associated peptidase YedK
MWRHSLEWRNDAWCQQTASLSVYRKKRQSQVRIFSQRRRALRLLLALWSGWTNPADKTELHSFTIITTDPNSLLEQYHNLCL